MQSPGLEANSAPDGPLLKSQILSQAHSMIQKIFYTEVLASALAFSRPRGDALGRAKPGSAESWHAALRHHGQGRGHQARPFGDRLRPCAAMAVALGD